MAKVVTQPLSFADDAPFRASGETVVDGTPEEVWAVLTDHESWPQWFGAGVKECTPTSGDRTGVGSTRRVKVGTATFDESFIAWDEPELWAFTATDIKPRVFKSLVERAQIERVDDGRTRITYTMAFDTRAGMRPVAPVLVKAISKSLDKGMAGLAAEVVKRRG